MRIAVVHSFYSARSGGGGEDAVVRDEVAALARHGHEVHLVSQSTDDRYRKGLYELETAFTVATTYGRSPLAELLRIEPDVTHVHNLFPNYGRTWVERWPGPLVCTVHNYRPLCAAATFFRDGEHCYECLQTPVRPALRYRCYRGSVLATAPLAIATRHAAAGDPLLRRADRVLTLNPRMTELYGTHGVPADRLRLMRNFLPEGRQAAPAQDGVHDGSWLFVGRLQPEKGALRLAERWPRGQRLVVVGTGDEQAPIKALEHPDIEVLGSRPREEILVRMAHARGLVFPSLWLEGQPLVYIEALASGLPVLAFDTNTVADLVAADRTGHTVSWDDDLEQELAGIAPRFDRMRSQVRAAFERSYTEAHAVREYLGVFREAAQHRAAASARARGPHP